jgi:hypothetical protein
MFRSQPIPMVQGDNQLVLAKLAVCYIYTTTDAHLNVKGTDSQALRLKVYGIDNTGETLLAVLPLETTGDYTANEYAACVFTGIKVEDYNAIYFTYDIKEVNKVTTDFNKIVGSPIMFVDVKVLPDVMQSTNYNIAVGA